jgi:Ni/Co efflux regulator RcnB
MMIKRAMIALAASAAFVPAAAAAQTVSDPDPAYGLPSMSLAVPAAALAAAAAPPAGAPMMRHGPPPHVGMPAFHNPPGAGMMMRHRGMNNMHMGMGRMGMGQMRHFNHVRVGRGAMVPHGWFGPQFVIRNWGGYGFPQPLDGGRWIRYYDDALLIDRDGRVLDGRYGMDWDRYGDRWDYDDQGVPYAGDYDDDDDDDYDRNDDDRDDDMDEGGDRDGHDGYGRGDRTYVHVERRDGRHGGPPMMPPPPPPPPGYGYGHGYGYGYGYGYGGGVVIVTETTVTTPPVVELRTHYVTERVRVAPRVRYRPRCVCRPAPRPRPGERG